MSLACEKKHEAGKYRRTLLRYGKGLYLVPVMVCLAPSRFCSQYNSSGAFILCRVSKQSSYKNLVQHNIKATGRL